MGCPVYIGIAGWSYPDWKDIIYTQPKMDQLEYVSRFVDCIEINNTFYRPPLERNCRSWLERTKANKDFFFTAKLSREFTHEGKIDRDLVKQYHEGFAPMLEAGKLKHLLVQFKYDFANTGGNREHLSRIVGKFRKTFRLTVEVRHRSWQDEEGLKFLEGLGINVCNLDYPTARNSFDMQYCMVGMDGYFRLHGRNVDAWFDKSAGRDETYDYYYRKEELGQMRKRIDRLADRLETLTVIANNHYRGAELANAIELKALLSGHKQLVPEGLLKFYKNLTEIALSGTEGELF